MQNMKNKSIKNPLFIVILLTTLGSCGPSKKTIAKTTAVNRKGDSLMAIRLIDSLNVMAKADSVTNKASMPPADTATKVAFENYRAEATMINQLIHTELHVSFDYGKQYLYGKAIITLKPYFYPTDTLTLDAKGMDIHEISLVKGKEKKLLKYTYDSLQLHINLDKVYTNKEEYTLYIEYTSMPNKLKAEQGGSAAITSHKGLFFINPDGKDKNKPRQIWTQGETEDNSCWFPTIDKPNQRQTEEIYMTVEKTEKTLSNGEMVSSVENKDNTRTDHWVMKPGIPPYLVMMAVGPFSIIHDKWKGKNMAKYIDVDYYVDAKYAPYAKDIFGKTPQMIEFFSNILQFPYPWNKYDQVIVHDYVSGAMENTTATLHGDFLNKTRRELIDDPLSTSEDIISHELFHHWFGDMVTCESWSNITLNESFADYSEFLWRQHAWGEDCAEQYMRQSIDEYMARPSPHDLVDFTYNDREDVFDGVSYNKGGGILHMLRTIVGDTAFFDALHLYLETNKYTAAEVPQLRIAFQKVTGRDLNWFFNEWYYNKGYPEITVNHSYDASAHKETLTIDQTQDLSKNPVFYMPLQIDVYSNGKKESHAVVMNKTKNTYVFDVAATPDLVVADGQKMMYVCVKTENMSLAEREYQYAHLPLYMDRYEALKDLSNHMEDAGARATMMKALHDRFWMLRRFAIEKLADSTPELKNILMDLASHDSSSNVRARAITALSSGYTDGKLMSIYKKAINDSSYKVESEALSAIAKINKQEALKSAKILESSDDKELLLGIASVYVQYGNDSCNNFFVKLRNYVSGFEEIPYVALYGKFLQQCSDSCVTRGVTVIGNVMKNADNRYVKYYAKSALNNLLSIYQDRENDLNGKISDMKAKNSGAQKLADLQKRLDSTTNIEKLINSNLE
jgi:aminopeptidase N